MGNVSGLIKVFITVHVVELMKGHSRSLLFGVGLGVMVGVGGRDVHAEQLGDSVNTVVSKGYSRQ